MILGFEPDALKTNRVLYGFFAPRPKILEVRPRVQNTIQVKYTNQVQVCTDLNQMFRKLNQQPGREK